MHILSAITKGNVTMGQYKYIDKLPCQPKSTAQSVRELSKVLGIKVAKDYVNDPFYHSVLAGIFLHRHLGRREQREVMENIHKMPGRIKSRLITAVTDAKYMPNWGNDWAKSTAELKNKLKITKQYQKVLDGLSGSSDLASDAYKLAKKPTKGIKAVQVILAVLSLMNTTGQGHAQKELNRRAACQKQPVLRAM